MEKRDLELIMNKSSSLDENGDFKSLLSELRGYYRSYVNHMNETIPLTKFHVALAQGNLSYVKLILEHVKTPTMIHFLLNQTVRFPCDRRYEKNDQVHLVDSTECPLRERKKMLTKLKIPMYMCMPLSMAAYSGSLELVRFILGLGANPELVGGKGNNIVHCLVYMSANKPEEALLLYQELVERLCPSTLYSLLTTENKNCRTVVDLAADLALPEMLLALLGTEGVFKFSQEDCGIHSHALYDVTRYEHCGTQVLHLFHYLTLVTEDELVRIDTVRMLQSEPLSSWIEAKFTSYKRVIWFCVLKSFLFLMLYLSSLTYTIIALKKPPLALNVMLAAAGIVSLVGDFHSVIRLRSTIALYWKHTLQRRKPVSICGTYRLFQILFSITVTTTSFLSMLDELSDTETTLGLHVCNVMFGFLSVVFYFQLGEYMGHLLTVIEKMIEVTFYFLTMICLVFMSLALSFYILHYHPSKCIDTSKNETLMDTCLGAQNTDYEMFSSFYRSIYETLLLAMGLMVPKSIYFQESEAPQLSQALYLLCLLFVTIVLMNLLVALVNQRIAEIGAHKQSILTIQRLSVLVYIQQNFDNKKLLRKIMYRLSGRRTLLMDESAFVFSKDRSRVYVHVVE